MKIDYRIEFMKDTLTRLNMMIDEIIRTPKMTKKEMMKRVIMMQLYLRDEGRKYIENFEIDADDRYGYTGPRDMGKRITDAQYKFEGDEND